jgi:hypothetical protein
VGRVIGVVTLTPYEFWCRTGASEIAMFSIECFGKTT